MEFSSSRDWGRRSLVGSVLVYWTKGCGAFRPAEFWQKLRE